DRGKAFTVRSSRYVYINISAPTTSRVRVETETAREDRDEPELPWPVPGSIRVLCRRARREDERRPSLRGCPGGHADHRREVEGLADALLAGRRGPVADGRRHGHRLGAECRQAEERLRRHPAYA